MNILNGANDFPDDVISRTWQRLIRQGSVPESPGMVCDGTVHLCAGAVLVREAVAVHRSEEAAGRFEREVTVRGSDYIRRVGCGIGLDGEAVGKIIIANDRLPGHNRLAGMLAYLDRLRLQETKPEVS